ncbi:MAG: hypothetical protein HY271_00525 [Deltaproteobacteria bacterium]|nr:hypothetical protein [Deltaproteobacteria bacterium]
MLPEARIDIDGVKAPRGIGADVALSLVTTVLLVAMVWALPRPIDDFFVGLAGGRDILAGHLGQPDDWAFTTHGRVWLDQNWGTHLLSYLVYCGFGETGMLAEKALMLVATAAFLVLACGAREVGLPAGLLVAGGAIAAARSYIDLRPNLTSTMLTPLLLWVLYRTRSHPHVAWAASLVLWLWSNAHGGFVLGLALMVVWVASNALAVAVQEEASIRWPRVWARCWPMAAAASAAVLLAAFANPFGIANLTHSFVVVKEPVWRSIDEWRPLFTSAGTPFGTTWEFVVVVTLGLLALERAARRAAHRRADSSATALLVFDIVAGALVVTMAVQARRFVPLAILVIAPPIAVQLDALLTGRRRPWPTVFVAAALLVPPVLLARPLVMRYRSDNPLYDRETMLQRMLVMSPFFPAKAADFVNANSIGGPVLNAWEWEGFLRWRGTRLRFLVGSRAQQVYDATTFAEQRRLLDADASPSAELATLDVHLALFPMTPGYNALLGALVYAEDAHWAYVYSDGLHVVLADTTWGGNAELVAAAERGALSYPDEETRALSRALYLASPASHADPEVIRDALLAAVAARPRGIAYACLGDLALSGRISAPAAIDYFETETRRLAAIDASGAGAAAGLEARHWAAVVLASLYRAAGRVQDADRRDAEASALAADVERLKVRWGWGDTPGFS